MENLLLTRREVATMLSRSADSVSKLDRDGFLPPSLLVGRSKRWLREDMEAFIKSHGLVRTAAEFAELNNR